MVHYMEIHNPTAHALYVIWVLIDVCSRQFSFSWVALFTCHPPSCLMEILVYGGGNEELNPVPQSWRTCNPLDIHSSFHQPSQCGQWARTMQVVVQVQLGGLSELNRWNNTWTHKSREVLLIFTCTLKYHFLMAGWLDSVNHFDTMNFPRGKRRINQSSIN